MRFFLSGNRSTDLWEDDGACRENPCPELLEYCGGNCVGMVFHKHFVTSNVHIADAKKRELLGFIALTFAGTRSRSPGWRPYEVGRCSSSFCQLLHQLLQPYHYLAVVTQHLGNELARVFIAGLFRHAVSTGQRPSCNRPRPTSSRVVHQQVGSSLPCASRMLASSPGGVV